MEQNKHSIFMTWLDSNFNTRKTFDLDASPQKTITELFWIQKCYH